MNLKFNLLLWSLTLAIAPFIFGFYQLYENPNLNIKGAFELIPVMFLMSFVFSLPTVILIYISQKILENNNTSSIIVCVISLSIFIAGIIITLALIEGTLSKIIAAVYCITATLIGTLLLLKKI